MKNLRQYGDMNDPDFIITLNNSNLEIMKYIQSFINIFQFSIKTIESINEIDKEENVYIKLDYFAYKTITCQYFFKKLHEKIIWPIERNYYRDLNNNYIS